ncbi:MAG: quinolinate synthase NadA [Hydrotalea flava]|uniref:quinolinate synthase NadA n=2 Tax=Chitinophagaceae TaxID=563835 RepID=UPI0016BA50CE|nr:MULTISPECIES: quinolinate synthase NadA [Hydrotalea]MBY0349073.1 quinolinate synthase NadA [Hydrotalea flava]NIM35541.1 quinolinate synthase NadA [Hydrotalea flava]NIM38398.1 quinolinate synthase NadA [Hydrotalea flava]NIN03568.1 quinolinate synthase NadA [Hydrotalea flava]NIN15255.1 quinolinate synthase NadA [Hydrotalea flava]
MNIAEAKANLLSKGFLDVDIDLHVDLFQEIEQLKKHKNAIILAHYYQEPDIQDIADYIGDSLGLAKQASQTDAAIILFAGVHFMAETAKILNPDKKVLLPDLKAGCSLADSAPTELFKQFKAKHPDHVVISYINCTAEIKALSDIICTSGNAEKIITDLPPDTPILFAPDKNLGSYLNKKTGRNMLLWNGACQVHEIFSVEKITRLKIRHPEAKLLAHPECEESVLAMADFIGSTTQLLKYSHTDSAQSYIVATETGILHQMQKDNPGKAFIPAPPNNNCACNDCPYMKLNTLEKVYNTLLYELPEITMEEDLRIAAKKPLDRMLAISKAAGLIG